MDDLISREDAQRITGEMLSGWLTDAERKVLEKVEAELGELPSVGKAANSITIELNPEQIEKYVKNALVGILPDEQKKGHWRNYEGTLTCSVCETEFDNGIMEYCGDDVPMFCPYCGADMRGEED